MTTEYFKEQPELEAVSDSSSSAPDVESEGSSADDTQLLQSVSHSLALVAGDQNFSFSQTFAAASFISAEGSLIGCCADAQLSVL